MRLFLLIMLLALGSVLLQQITGCGTTVSQEEGMARGLIIILPLFLIILFFYFRSAKKPAERPRVVEKPQPKERAPQHEGAETGIANARRYDRQAWETLQQLDPSVAPALKRIEPLGNKWVDEFAFRVTSSSVDQRNVAEISEAIVGEHTASQKISTVEAINEGYQKADQLYGEAGAAKFKEMYQIVGDNLDVARALEELKVKPPFPRWIR